MSQSLTTTEPGSFAHYAKWQPHIDHERYTIDLRPLEGVAMGQEAFGFTCLIARNSGDTEQLPKFIGSAWGQSPDEAQYRAFKQAAYLLEFGTLPVPPTVSVMLGEEETFDGHLIGGLRVIPEYE